jgi:myo-inositol-1(or 4)-monophosphatase
VSSGVPAPGFDPSPPSPEELAQLALDAARAAGQLVLAGLARDRRVTMTKSSITDVVTEVDRASEQLILERIRRARPDDTLLGEEGGRRTGSSDVTWIVDPIDGTVNYLYGHPGFAVSIAAETDDGVVAGVVLDPWHDEAFVATKGGGARCNGEPLAVTEATDPRLALVATGFAYVAAQRARQAAVVAHLLPRVRDIRRVGSAALDLCSVAAGRVDAYYETGLNPWDLAAGALIAAEAGALVTDLSGQRPPSGVDGVLAANPALHRELVPLLADAARQAAP